MKELKTYRDVVNAILGGHEVEYWHPHNKTWLPLVYIYSELRNLDKESLNNRYRVKPSKPSINWEHVDPRYNYLARDINGSVYLYEKEPYKLTKTWSSSTGDVCAVRTHSSLKVGNCDWTESLVKRPE